MNEFALFAGDAQVFVPGRPRGVRAVVVTMEFTYRREGHRPFPEMLEAVERTARSRGFDIVRTHDLQATLAAKGFEIQPLVVLDIGMPGSGDDLCKVHVYAEGDIVWVSAIRPLTVWADMRTGGGGPAVEAEDSVRSLVDAACT